MIPAMPQHPGGQGEATSAGTQGRGAGDVLLPTPCPRPAGGLARARSPRDADEKPLQQRWPQKLSRPTSARASGKRRTVPREPQLPRLRRPPEPSCPSPPLPAPQETWERGFM